MPSRRPDALKADDAAWKCPGEPVVFVLEPCSGTLLKYDHHAWEDRWLAIVDVILFWIPRDMRHMPGLTTNVEFGRWESSGRIVLGAPPTAVHVGYLRECAVRNDAPITSTLDDAAAAAMTMVGGGSYRCAAERQIPLPVWRHPEFQAWLTARREAGLTLANARVLWLQRDEDHTARRWVMNAQFNGQIEEFLAFGDLVKPDAPSFGSGPPAR